MQARLPELSSLLDRELSSCPAFAGLRCPGGNDDLCFHAVENSLGFEGDDGVRLLATAIADAVETLPSMKKRVPLKWRHSLTTL